jgi:hypothetical protein
MESPSRKYELAQGERKYTLSTQIYQDKLRFACSEVNTINPLVYIGEFTLYNLMQLSKLFSSISDISQAQEIFDKIITSQKVVIEPQQNQINLRILIKRDNQPDEHFFLVLNLFNKDGVNNEQSLNQNITDNKYTREELNKEYLSLLQNTRDSNQINEIANSTSNLNISQGQYMQSSQAHTGENVMFANSASELQTNNLAQTNVNESITNNNIETSQNIDSSNNINLDQYLQNQQTQSKENMLFTSTTSNTQTTQNVSSSENINLDQYMQNQAQTQIPNTDNIYFNTTSTTETTHTINSPSGNVNLDNFLQTPQNQTTENIIYNSSGTSGNIQQNITYSGSSNNYEKSVLHKSKRTRVDKLTLSLRAQPNLRLSEDNKIIDIENYKINEQTYSETLSPQKTQDPYIQENTPLFQEKQINYESPKDEQNIFSQHNIPETSYDSSQQIYSSLKTTNIVQQNDTNEKDRIIEELRNENNRLKMELNQLRSRMEIIITENRNLKLNIGKSIPNGNDNEEILFLKQENERYLKEIDRLRLQLGQLNEFEQYKISKEKEITMLKIQIEELLANQKKIEEFAQSKQREIDELKLYLEELLKNQKELKLRSSQNQISSKMNLEDQMLTIQDTRLEIVRGDIIQNAVELELLSRKICKKRRKIILNLLYKAKVDSDKAEAFHNKCDFAKSTLVLVKSANGKRFGGYTTCDWKGNNIEKKDENAFVFSLDKMKIYDIIPGEDAIGCYPKYGPVFLGCQIRIYDEFFTNGGTTFEKGLNYNTEEDFELTGGLKKFDVKDIEVYSVEFE